MSEPAYWELDVPWADAGVSSSTTFDGDQQVVEHEIAAGGVLRLADDSGAGARVEVVRGPVTVFRSTQENGVVLGDGAQVELREKHWWRNDSGAPAVVRITRPA